MNKITKCIVNILLLAVLLEAKSQQLGYVDTDSAYYSGLLNTGILFTPRRCVILSNNKRYKFFPKQVKEFGFQEGSVFISQDIILNNNKKRVFLRLIEDDTLTGRKYYYYRRLTGTAFAIADSSGFRQLKLNKNEPGYYMKEFAGSLSCAEEIGMLEYPHSVIGFRAMKKDCQKGKFRHVVYARIGFKDGITIQSISLNKLYRMSAHGFINRQNAVILEYPFFHRFLSIRHEMAFSAFSGYLDHSRIKGLDLKYLSLNTPVHLKMTTLNRKLRMYALAGITYQHNLVYYTESTTETINNNSIDLYSLIQKNLLGTSIIAGVETNMRSVPVFMELQLNQYNMMKPDKYQSILFSIGCFIK